MVKIRTPLAPAYSRRVAKLRAQGSLVKADVRHLYHGAIWLSNLRKH